MDKLKLLIGVFRPLRWYRNLFVVFGAFIAVVLNDLSAGESWPRIIGAFVVASLIASANYGVNEVADAESDSHHPRKKFRAVANGSIGKKTVIAVSIFLYAIGFFAAWKTGSIFFLGSAFLLFLSGMLYNLPPVRLKDLPYLDFSFEALNNSIRLLMGWYAVTAKIVPISFLLFFWFIGIFLMAAKRFAEIRFIKNPEEAKAYRKSLEHYTQEKLLFAMIGAVSAASFMFGVLTVKHEIGFVLTLPMVIIFIIWFFALAYEEDSIVKDPERIFERKWFLIYALALVSVSVLLVRYPVKFLDFFLE